jgi:hypothetical protein
MRTAQSSISLIKKESKKDLDNTFKKCTRKLDFNSLDIFGSTSTTNAEK